MKNTRHTSGTSIPGLSPYIQKRNYLTSNVTEKTGIDLTESYAMVPTAAVSGWYLATRKQVFRRRRSIARSDRSVETLEYI